MPKNNLLTKMSDKAAKKASLALSKLSNEKVAVEFAKSAITKIQSNVLTEIDPESIVAGVYLPITGEIKGATLLLFPKKFAFDLCDILAGRKQGTTRQLTELDQSAIKEVGNIVCGNLMTVFSNILKVRIIEHAPVFSFDMFGAISDQIIVQFAQKTEEVLTIEIKLSLKNIQIKGYILVVLEVKKIEAILNRQNLN